MRPDDLSEDTSSWLLRGVRVGWAARRLTPRRHAGSSLQRAKASPHYRRAVARARFCRAVCQSIPSLSARSCTGPILPTNRGQPVAARGREARPPKDDRHARRHQEKSKQSNWPLCWSGPVAAALLGAVPEDVGADPSRARSRPRGVSDRQEPWRYPSVVVVEVGCQQSLEASERVELMEVQPPVPELGPQSFDEGVGLDDIDLGDDMPGDFVEVTVRADDVLSDPPSVRTLICWLEAHASASLRTSRVPSAERFDCRVHASTRLEDPSTTP